MYMYERNETSTDAEHTGKIKTRSRTQKRIKSKDKETGSYRKGVKRPAVRRYG